MNTELLAFLDTQSARLTPEDIAALAARLPALRERFLSIAGLESPELAEQLEFLAQIVEDCAAGVNCEVPDTCRREAAFALLYLEREGDILPDAAPEIGLVDGWPSPSWRCFCLPPARRARVGNSTTRCSAPRRA